MGTGSPAVGLHTAEGGSLVTTDHALPVCFRRLRIRVFRPSPGFGIDGLTCSKPAASTDRIFVDEAVHELYLPIRSHDL